MGNVYLICNIDLKENTGATSHFKNLYFALKSKYKIKALVRDVPDLSAQLNHNDFHIVHSYYNKKLKIWGTLLNILSFEIIILFKLILLNISENIDGIYLRQTHLNFSVSLFCFLFRKPLIVEVNSLILEDLKESKLNIVKTLEKLAEFFTFSASCQIRVVTENMKKYLINTFSIDDSILSYIPNGFNFKSIEQYEKEFTPSDKNNHNFQFLFVGLLHKREGIHILIQALNLIKKDKNFHLNILGNGPYFNRLNDLVIKNNLENYISFIGEVHPEKLRFYYEKADICFAPLIQERNKITGMSPIKVYEYLAHKCPMICSDLPGLEFIEKFQCGLLVPPDSPELLANKINWLLDNYNEKAHKIALNGFKYVTLNHSWAKITEEILNLCSNGFDKNRHM